MSVGELVTFLETMELNDRQKIIGAAGIKRDQSKNWFLVRCRT